MQSNVSDAIAFGTELPGLFDSMSCDTPIFIGVSNNLITAGGLELKANRFPKCTQWAFQQTDVYKDGGHLLSNY